VKDSIPQIERLVEAIEPRMQRGGRLFYIGAGTSGRLGVLDASELPPTFGVPETWVTGLIAGGDRALRHAVENAEDIAEQGWKDLTVHHPTEDDSVIGIAASGTTPYVVGAVRRAREAGLLTGCITSNPSTPLAEAAEFPVETIVGPEFVTGSSRMKSGTAQKMVLNMLSTTLMIRLGRVEGNRMVNMQLTNAKLVDRGTRMIQDTLGISYDEARQRLLQAGSVSRVLWQNME
jgi:N-acetylmuramic acid 6-phosphate etherase